MSHEICRCPAFPWPHALLLSRRCANHAGFSSTEDRRYAREAWDAVWANEEARLDARERAEASNAAR